MPGSNRRWFDPGWSNPMPTNVQAEFFTLRVSFIITIGGPLDPLIAVAGFVPLRPARLTTPATEQRLEPL